LRFETCHVNPEGLVQLRFGVTLKQEKYTSCTEVAHLDEPPDKAHDDPVLVLRRGVVELYVQIFSQILFLGESQKREVYDCASQIAPPMNLHIK